MRVLHVMEVSHGGVPTLVAEFAAAQAEAGLDVHVLAPTDSPATAGTRHDWTPRRGRPDTYPGAVAALHRTVGEVRPDVVHLHSFFPGLWGRLRRLPARVVYQPHSWAFSATSSRPVRAALGRWESLAAGRCDALVVNCEDERDEGRAHGVRAEMSVIGVPIDTDRYRPAEEREQHDEPAERPQRRAALVCLGRISRQKGQDLLAAAWERRPLPDTDLFLVGPGETDEVRALAATTYGGSLHAVGSTDDALGWWRRADLAVLPSRYEGQSVAMAEALSSGVPVVMTAVNGAREAVAPPGEPAAGAIVPVGDMDALLDACAALLAEPAGRREASRAARDRALRLFARQAVLARLQEVYDGA
jgi:glycosyltransferase involved in cell wall biosynthesis